MTQMTIQQAMELATQHHQAGRLAQAEQIYRQVLSVDPNEPDALHLLGVIAIHSGQPAAAIELIGRAIAKHPQTADLHYNMGLALMLAGRVEEAAGSFRQAIVIQPARVDARGNLAAALLYLKRLDEAVDLCEQTVAMKLESPEVFNAFGVALKDKERTDEAVSAFERALALRPDYCEAMSNLGNAIKKQGKIAEAIAIHRRAVSLRPDLPEVHNNLGRALDDDYQYEPAIAEFRRALEIKPDYPEAQCSFATVLHRMGQFDRAIEASRKALQLWPDSGLARFNISLMLLLQGQFEEGWRLHESRWNVPDLGMTLPNLGKPAWEGQECTSSTILIYGEQGFGDVIQFSRYVPLVAQRGATVTLICQPELVRLMRTLSGASKVVARTAPPGKFDLQCPLLSLPMIFKTNLSNIPASIPYLHTDAALTDMWQKRVPSEPGKIRIGLAWAGRPEHTNDRNRSMPLSMLAPLAKIPNTWFCSLQKGNAAAQTDSLPHGLTITDFSQDLNDFADTAALIQNLDLVITVDTVAAHLAGALGKPVWMLTPFVPDWRWMLGRDDSPWYPTMRLFRQPVAEDWRPVIDKVLDSLAQFKT